MDFYFTQVPDRLSRSEMPMRSCAIDFSLSMFPLRIFLVLICLWAYAAQLPAQREWQASDVLSLICEIAPDMFLTLTDCSSLPSEIPRITISDGWNGARACSPFLWLSIG